MCTTCGCGGDGARVVGGHQHDHEHGHSHSHDHSHHEHGAGDVETRTITLEKDLLAKNDAYAATNRQAWADKGLFVLNLVSSPGSGKTTLLTSLIERLKGSNSIGVIEGDQQTTFDADRIKATGVPAIQINTGKGCHLDAHMVGHALDHMNLPEDSLLFVENVGNLVCPAGFDLGENHKVVILSVTEGEDKPLKYPDMFAAADLMILNKVDLLPHLAFDVDLCVGYALRVNPGLKVIQLSATTGENLDQLVDWILAGAAGARAKRTETVAELKRKITELEARLASQG
jgi:hydrogenase nickel incorporation protein HypB